MDDYGYVLTDSSMSSSLKGLYCAGDIVKKAHRQMVTATSDGCIAALGVNEYLNKNK
jgi:thioredoxin reductase (NADPH)